MAAPAFASLRLCGELPPPVRCEFGKLNARAGRCPNTASETDFYGHHWCAEHGTRFDVQGWTLDVEWSAEAEAAADH